MQTKTFEPGQIVRLVTQVHYDKTYGKFYYANPVGSRAEVYLPYTHFKDKYSLWLYVKWIDNPARMPNGGYYKDDFIRCVDEDTFEVDGVE